MDAAKLPQVANFLAPGVLVGDDVPWPSYTAVMSAGENPDWERLWTPWRYAYVTGDRSGGDQRPGVPPSLMAWPGDHGCVFCNVIAAVDYAIEHGMAREQAEAAAWVLERGTHGFLMLNAFPYNSGHLMAVPYAHQDSLAGLTLPVAEELLRLTRRAERALRSVYKPHGLNIGLNLGAPAGAGIAEHLHIHSVPRWTGDNNFMAVLAGTRVLPEVLDESWKRVREALAADAGEVSNPVVAAPGAAASSLA